jgi:hypothetical protein
VATERTFIRARAVRWMADEPSPGLVEVEFSDAAGQLCRFVDKAPIFDSTGTLGSSSRYPVELDLACTIVARQANSHVVSTAEPWGLESVDGRFTFVVRPEQLVAAPPEPPPAG